MWFNRLPLDVYPSVALKEKLWGYLADVFPAM